jgi:hypothetical protein
MKKVPPKTADEELRENPEDTPVRYNNNNNSRTHRSARCVISVTKYRPPRANDYESANNVSSTH